MISKKHRGLALIECLAAMPLQKRLFLENRLNKIKLNPKEYLKKKGVETQIHYKQILPLMKAYKYLNLKAKSFPNAFKASKEILSLPISPEKSKKEINNISRLIINFLRK